MFKDRLISGTIVVVACAAILFFAPAWAFAVLVSAFIIFGLNEFFVLLESKQVGVNRKLGIFLGVVVSGVSYFDYRLPDDWSLIFIPVVCLVIFIIQFSKRDHRAVLSIATILFGLVYISWFLSFMIRIRTMPLGSELFRKSLVAYLILVTKSGDIGAYLIGTKFGRHSLIPRISPQKTVEGAVGGLLVSILVSLFSHGFLPNLSQLRLLVLGLTLGTLAQVGDLSESLIKRDCAVKDSGKAFPGLGGVLDAIDSLLFTAPALYFYVKVFM